MTVSDCFAIVCHSQHRWPSALERGMWFLFVFLMSVGSLLGLGRRFYFFLIGEINFDFVFDLQKKLATTSTVYFLQATSRLIIEFLFFAEHLSYSIPFSIDHFLLVCSSEFVFSQDTHHRPLCKFFKDFFLRHFLKNFFVLFFQVKIDWICRRWPKIKKIELTKSKKKSWSRIALSLSQAYSLSLRLSLSYYLHVLRKIGVILLSAVYKLF